MQADIDMLKRHRSDLEDRELEVMEQRETLDNEITSREGEQKRLQDDATRLHSAIAAARGRDRRRSRDRDCGARGGRGRDLRRVAEQLPAPPRAEPRGRRGAARRHDVPGVPPDDPVDRSGTHPPVRGERSRVLRQLRRDPRPVNQLSFEPTSDDDRPAEILVYCDGGSRGNPGPAAIGAVVLDPSTDPPTRVADGVRDHRHHDEQRRRVPGADRRARGRGTPATRIASACAPIRC